MQLKRTAQMVGTVQKRQLGRKMQILHKLATCFLCKITDAPHTGGRLETRSGRHLRRYGRLMPPTRGHDLKPGALPRRQRAGRDAPHTGARLETRDVYTALGWRPEDAPHTGARLETNSSSFSSDPSKMPPTRGHDLKRLSQIMPTSSIRMPPTRGHDLKLLFVGGCIGIFGCPPHGGTT